MGKSIIVREKKVKKDSDMQERRLEKLERIQRKYGMVEDEYGR